MSERSSRESPSERSSVEAPAMVPAGDPYDPDTYGHMVLVDTDTGQEYRDEVAPQERARRAREVDAALELNANIGRLNELGPDDGLAVHKAWGAANERAALLGEPLSFEGVASLLREGLDRASREPATTAKAPVQGPIETGIYSPPSSMPPYEGYGRLHTPDVALGSHSFEPSEASELFHTMEGGLRLEDSPSERLQMEREGIEPLTPQEKAVAELIIDFGHSMAIRASEEGQLLDGGMLLGEGAEARLTEAFINDPSLVRDSEFQFLSEKDQRDVIARTFKSLRERATRQLDSKS